MFLCIPYAFEVTLDVCRKSFLSTVKVEIGQSCLGKKKLLQYYQHESLTSLTDCLLSDESANLIYCSYTE